MKKLVAVGATAAVAAGALAVPTFGAGTKIVAVKDNFFVPKTLTVTRGTTVRWVWRGKVPHDVTVTKGPQRFRSTIQTKGSFSRRLTKPGVYTIICTIHQPNMKMTLRVK
jgi:plastocyanin